jgi:hypothetical protein
MLGAGPGEHPAELPETDKDEVIIDNIAAWLRSVAHRFLPPCNHAAHRRRGITPINVIISPIKTSTTR